MHFVQPETDFRTRYLSEYVLGAKGRLLNLAFAGNLLGSLAFLLAVYRAYPPPHRSIAALACYGIATLAIVTNFFPTDPHGQAVGLSGHVHNLGGFVGGLAALVFFAIHTVRLHSLGLLRGLYRALPVLAVAGPLLFVAVLVAAARAGDVVGLVQRAYVGVVMLWLILAALGIRTGALSAPAGRAETPGPRY